MRLTLFSLIVLLPLAARAEDSEVPERVARALAGELGWDDARTAEEAETFRATAQAEGIRPAG